MVYDPPEDYPPKQSEDSEQPPPPILRPARAIPLPNSGGRPIPSRRPITPTGRQRKARRRRKTAEQTPPPTPEADEIAPQSGFVWSTDSAPMPDYPYWPSPESAPPAAKKRRSIAGHAGRLARDLIETVILALLIFVGVRAMVQNFRVEGSSMESTLHDGQYILVNKAVYFKVDVGFLDFLPFYDAGSNPVHYIFRAPRRGDVVVFRFPNQTERDFIKRIIGEPGDVVQVKDGLVFVNGGALDEKYILERPNYDFGPEVVPDGQLLRPRRQSE